VESLAVDQRNPGTFRAWAAVSCGLVLAACALPPLAEARPETIRAGVSYYSEELIENGPIRDIGVERNYEEVFERYTYYEVVYDESERVIRCLTYKRGSVTRKDTYRYAADGSLLEHTIDPPQEPATATTAPDPADTASDAAGPD
jgi:hypothetical protein